MERVLQLRRINKKRPMKAKKKPSIKVTYISNPMKVRANNESEFRSIVQELTGKNSNVDWPELEAHDDEFVMAAASGGANSETVGATPSPPADVEQGMIEIETSSAFEYLDDHTSNYLLDNLYGFQSLRDWGVLA